jgi:hypothetical protein
VLRFFSVSSSLDNRVKRASCILLHISTKEQDNILKEKSRDLPEAGIFCRDKTTTDRHNSEEAYLPQVGALA